MDPFDRDPVEPTEPQDHSWIVWVVIALGLVILVWWAVVSA